MTPSRLYKYEPCNARTFQNIKGQILYFGSPLGFNDPYDCALTPNFRRPTDEEVDAIRSHYLSQSRLTALQRTEFRTKNTNELREMLLRVATEVVEQQIDDVLHNCGITCFSERNDDLLMWSHYTGRAKGVCLEFDTSAAPFHKIKAVRYVEVYPQLDIANILVSNDLDAVIDLFCTKSISWSYEREWRALHKVAATQYIYPAAALTGVYFGPDIDEESLEIACLILAGQNEAVRLYKGVRSTSEFKVLFNEFTYTSYLQAKQLGVRE